jgi:nucleoside-diphosphate-sugar epimerase
VGHVVLISSVAVYGSPGVPSVDETFPCNPSGVYEESKYEGEEQSRAAISGSGTRLTILRPATIYGPGDRGNVARLVRALDKGRFFWIGDGLNLKSLLFLEDFARACVRAALQGTESDVYNVSAPAETMRSVVDAIAEALGKRPPRISIPAVCARSAAAMAALSPVARARFHGLRRTLRKWLAHDAYDAGKFSRRFGEFVQVPLREGMRREVEWHVAHR